MAYLYGFISHYVLIALFIPMFFYKTGELEKKRIKKVISTKDLHHNMEVFIDNYLINNREKGKVYSFFNSMIFVLNFTPFSKELEEVIDYAFKETFGITEMSNILQTGFKRICILHLSILDMIKQVLKNVSIQFVRK